MISLDLSAEYCFQSEVIKPKLRFYGMVQFKGFYPFLKRLKHPEF